MKWAERKSTAAKVPDIGLSHVTIFQSQAMPGVIPGKARIKPRAPSGLAPKAPPGKNLNDMG